MKPILDSSEFSQPINIVRYRRSLLPWWIKGFSWLFMIFGVMIFPISVMSIFGVPTELSLYGIESTSILNLNGALVTIMFLISGIVGFALFYGKDWALNAGLVLCAAHLLLVVLVYALQLATHGSNLRFEFILVVPFFIKLLKLRPLWDGPQNNASI